MNSSFFVDAVWVKKEIEQKNKNTVILDMPYGKNEYVTEHDSNKRLYEDKHLPGAIHIDKTEFEGESTDLNIYKPEKIEKMFLSKGITKDTQLIIYSDGIIAATRVAFIAYWIGVNNVKILNGGLKAWEEAGFPFESGKVVPVQAEEFGLDVPARPEIVISTPEDLMKAKEENPDLVIASIRSWEEYIGKDSGYSYIELSGSPLGSVYAKASTDRKNVEYLLDDDGNFGDKEKIFAEWKKWGITQDKEVVFFCGAGWRASTAFFLTKEAGWQNVKLYDGGWYQWKKFHDQNPEKYAIQKGNPLDGDVSIINY